jgi:serine/threonine-protein kinase HipA
MSTARRSSAEHGPRLVALLDGRLVGAVHQDTGGRLRLVYEEAWRTADDAYPLSLSMPLTASEHRHDEVHAYLWGLLPDNERTLDRYARMFGVSARNPVALLAHIGADCAGAVQFVSPDRVSELEGSQAEPKVEYLSEAEVAQELRSARETGLPGLDRQTVGRFSLAGAQAKIALFHADGRWGRPLGRTPTTHILKPPSTELAGFAENEYLCLALAGELGLRAARSAVRRFDDEVAIVVERFDRLRTPRVIRRVHQEDMCQALSVLPWNKYENEGGPGAAAIVALMQESSLDPDVDIARFIDVLALHWVLATTDAHAKNYAFLHVPGGGVRLAPFYDIASYLPYVDRRLHDVRLAMRIGKEYLVRRIALADWKRLAESMRLDAESVLKRIETLLPRIPDAMRAVARRAVDEGLASELVDPLAERIIERTRDCEERLAGGKTAA